MNIVRINHLTPHLLLHELCLYSRFFTLYFLQVELAVYDCLRGERDICVVGYTSDGLSSPYVIYFDWLVRYQILCMTWLLRICLNAVEILLVNLDISTLLADIQGVSRERRLKSRMCIRILDRQNVQATPLRLMLICLLRDTAIALFNLCGCVELACESRLHAGVDAERVVFLDRLRVYLQTLGVICFLLFSRELS